jgi:hypothetical protein
MKAFAIFPTISIFIVIFTLLKSEWELQTKKNLIWTSIVTAIIGGLLTMYSTEMFMLLYLSNFIFILILIPFLTFLINSYMPKTSGRTPWTRLLLIGLIGTAITMTLFVVSFFFSLMNNPMDIGPK